MKFELPADSTTGYWSATDIEKELHNTSSQRLEGLQILANGVARDINNLLTTIICNSDMILEHDSDSSLTEKRMSRFREAAGMASDLTHQILSYVGKGERVFEAVNLNQMIFETRKMLKIAPEKRAVLVFDLDRVSSNHSDVSMIIRIVMNMIVNASEIIPQTGGYVRVSLSQRYMPGDELKELDSGYSCPEGEYVVITVSDIGAGIDRETLSNMFGPVHHSDYSETCPGVTGAAELIRYQNGAILTKFVNGGEKSTSVLFPVAAPEDQLKPVVEFIDEVF